jgi:hypothetical protein
MVDHPPSTIDASEPVRYGKRKGVATDQFDANHPALIPANHRDGVCTQVTSSSAQMWLIFPKSALANAS